LRFKPNIKQLESVNHTEVWTESINITSIDVPQKSIPTASKARLFTYQNQIVNNSNSSNKFIMSNKTLKISGMTCGHCSARVEKALNSLEGVEAKVFLEANEARVSLSKEVSNDTLKQAVEAAGYEVVEIV